MFNKEKEYMDWTTRRVQATDDQSGASNLGVLPQFLTRSNEIFPQDDIHLSQYEDNINAILQSQQEKLDTDPLNKRLPAAVGLYLDDAICNIVDSHSFDLVVNNIVKSGVRFAIHDLLQQQHILKPHNLDHDILNSAVEAAAQGVCQYLHRTFNRYDPPIAVLKMEEDISSSGIIDEKGVINVEPKYACNILKDILQDHINQMTSLESDIASIVREAVACIVTDISDELLRDLASSMFQPVQRVLDGLYDFITNYVCASITEEAITSLCVSFDMSEPSELDEVLARDIASMTF